MARNRALTGGLIGAAGLIAVLTIASRIVGFGRIVVFSATVGLTDIGDIYQTINTLPNIVFEIVAGGALSAVIVPLIAGAAANRDTATVDRWASALLTWVVLIMTPLALTLAAFATPITRLLLGGDASGADVTAGARMLAIFAPQLVLYGVGVVLTGVLQAHHRFGWPAIAPMLSSLTVIATYIVFGVVAGRGATLSTVSTADQLLLAGGTTAGVAVLTLSLLIPLRGVGVRLRPTLGFPQGHVRRMGGLIASGVATVGAQYLCLLVILIVLQAAPDGSVVAFNLVQTVYLVPWAVLAVPIATSAYPRLAAAFSNHDTDTYRATLRPAARLTLATTTWAAAILVACAHPIAVVLMAAATGNTRPDPVAASIIAFAPGLLGYGLVALLTRALYAADQALAPAIAAVTGWVVAIAAVVGFSYLVPHERLTAVAAANTLGMTVAGIALIVMVWRNLGAAALRGTTRTAIAAIVAGGAAAGAGYAVAAALPHQQVWPALGSMLAAAVATSLVFVLVVATLDRPTATQTVTQLKRRVSARKPRELAGD